MPSLQDLVAGFDPTGSTTITTANLLNLINAAAPNTDQGLVITTTDVIGVPQVPDAATNTKWQRYVWRRIQTVSVVVYVWNPGIASDATYLNWQSITVASIADGSITNNKYAALSITDDKILSCGWAKLTGIPSGFAPTGAAGGDLTGTYPNPTVTANAIDRTKLQSDAAVDANRAVGTNHIQNQAVTVDSKLSVGATLSILRTKADLSGAEWVTKLITQLAEPDNTVALNSVRVKADGSGFEYRTTKQVWQQIIADTTICFISAETALAATTTTTLAHGLGALPTSVRAILRCKTADLGYAVGQEIDISTILNSAESSPNFQLSAVDATNVEVLQFSATPHIRRHSDWTYAAVTPANWRLVVYAKL